MEKNWLDNVTKDGCRDKVCSQLYTEVWKLVCVILECIFRYNLFSKINHACVHVFSNNTPQNMKKLFNYYTICINPQISPYMFTK